MRELLILFAAVHADAEDLRASRFKFGDISLIRLELARSAAREGLDVEGQHHALLGAKVGKPDGCAVLVGQREIRSRVTCSRGGHGGLIRSDADAPREGRSCPTGRAQTSSLVPQREKAISILLSVFWILTSAFCLLLLVLEQTAHRVRARRIDGRRVLFDVLDDTFFIHHERRAVGETVLLVQDAVFHGNFALEIAQQREVHADLFREGLIGGGTVHADAEDLRVGLLEFGDISLIRLQLLRSTAGERQNVERQHDVLLAQKVAKLDDLAVLVR